MFAMRPGEPVVDQHEQDDGDGAEDHRELGLLDRVAAHGRADLGLEGLVQRRRQRARAQHADQILRLLLQLERIAEAAQRDAAARADAALDHRRAVDLVVEQHRHLAADVVAGHLLGDRRALAVELEADLGAAGLLVPGLVGVRQVLAGQRRAPVQVERAPVAVGRHLAAVRARLVLLVADLVVGRDRQVAGQAREELLQRLALLRAQVDVLVLLARVLLASTTRARPRCPNPWAPRRRPCACTPSRRRRS